MRRTFYSMLALLCLYGTVSRAQSNDRVTDEPDCPTQSRGGQESRGRKPKPEPLPVRDLDNPGRNPFQQSFEQVLQFLMPDAESTFTVPEGRRLVIEHVSAMAQGQASASAPWGLRCVVSTTAGGGSANLLVNLAPVGFQGGLNQVSVGNLHARAYADGGSEVRTVCTRVNFSSRSVSVDISVIGHLVDERISADRSIGRDTPHANVPVVTSEVENAARHPFQRSFQVDPAVAEGVSVDVPGAKRLVLEEISMQSAGDTPAVCTVSTIAGGAPATLFIASASVYGVNPSAVNQIFIVSERVEAFADGGSDVSTRCFGLGLTGRPVAADVSIIGHLASR